MDRNDLERLLPDYFAGELTPAQFEEIAELLKRDPQARAELEAYELQERQLTQFFATARRRAETQENPLVEARVIEALAPRSEPRRVRAWLRRRSPLWGLAAAALLFMTLLALWMVYRETVPTGTAELAQVRELTGAAMIVAGNSLTPLKVGDPVRQGQHVKVADGGYLALDLPRGNVLEARGGTQLSLRDFPDRTEVAMNFGQVWAHLNNKPAKPFKIVTTRLQAVATGTVFGVEDALDRSTVAVARGSVNVEQVQRAGAAAVKPPVKVETGEAWSTRSGATAPVPPLQWSRFLTDLAGLTKASGAPDSGDARARRMLASLEMNSRLARTTSSLAQALWPPPPAGTLVDQMPTSSTWFMEVRDWSALVKEFRATDYSQLLAEPALRNWWNTARQKPEMVALLDATHAIDIVSLAALLDGEVALGGAGGDVLLIADCHAHAAEVETSIHTLYLATAAKRDEGATTDTLEARYQAFRAQAFVQSGRLILATSPALARAAAARLAANQTGGFTGTPFYKTIASNVSKPTFMIAVDFADVMARLGPKLDPTTQNQLKLTGISGLSYLLVASDFVGRGLNQALRLGFIDKRSGIADWMAEPAPMRGFEFFTPEVHAFAAVIARDPKQMFFDVLNYEMNEGHAIAEQNMRQYFDKHLALLGALGGEVAVGLDSPILPVPNVKIAVEILHREAAEKEMESFAADLANQLTLSGHTVTRDVTDFQGRQVHTMTIDHLPVVPSYAFVNDYLVFGPGVRFVEDSITVFDSGRSIAGDPRLLDLLPPGGDPNFSFLLYQDLLRVLSEVTQSTYIPLLSGAPAAGAGAAQTSATLAASGAVPTGAGAGAGGIAGLFPNLSFLQKYRAAGLAFAFAYQDHVDLHLRSPQGVDLDLGVALPIVANWLTPLLNPSQANASMLDGPATAGVGR